MNVKVPNNPHNSFAQNLSEILRLVKIYTQLAGTTRGRKYDVEVLHKSSIVLLVACWEAFIEDLAEQAFEILLENSKDHKIFSPKVLALIGDSFKASKDPGDCWRLAGDGWREVLKSHKEAVFKKHTRYLNTPDASHVDEIYESLIGIRKISSNWQWKRMSSENAQLKLGGLIRLRGSIAHRVTTSSSIRKDDVRNYIEFINRIAIETSNAVRSELARKTGKNFWKKYVLNKEVLVKFFKD